MVEILIYTLTEYLFKCNVQVAYVPILKIQDDEYRYINFIINLELHL